VVRDVGERNAETAACILKASVVKFASASLLLLLYKSREVESVALAVASAVTIVKREAT
jgi:hypothetical protein